jgi:hypothetical protein
MTTPTPITVTAHFITATDQPAVVKVIFENTLYVSNSSGSTMVPSKIEGVVSNGDLSMVVPASNDPTWAPVGWTWRIRTILDNAHEIVHYAVVPYNAPGATINFGSLTPVADVDGTLYAAYNHTHSTYQGLDSDLTQIAALTASNDDFIQRKAGSWANRTIPQVKVDLGVDQVDNTSDLGKPVSTATQTALALKASIASLAAVATTGQYSDMIGTVPTGALPALAITQPFPVANQAAMLALTAQRGDVAIRADNGRTYILATDSPTTLADWLELPAVGVITSVNGYTGVVVLTKNDVGLGNVNNTSDADKPVSTAQLAYIDLQNALQTFTINIAYDQSVAALLRTDAKNGLVQIRMCGFKASSGAPGAGTWAVGDAVIDSDGLTHVCSVAGTPGTWT